MPPKLPAMTEPEEEVLPHKKIKEIEIEIEREIDNSLSPAYFNFYVIWLFTLGSAVVLLCLTIMLWLILPLAIEVIIAGKLQSND